MLSLIQKSNSSWDKKENWEIVSLVDGDIVEKSYIYIASGVQRIIEEIQDEFLLIEENSDLLPTENDILDSLQSNMDDLKLERLKKHKVYLEQQAKTLQMEIEAISQKIVS